MNEKKLTDEEIVKALEHCATENTCRGCVKYNGETKIDYFKCMRDTRKNVVDLFHRLQAENERLNDMKFTQEHCDLYKENELLKSALKRELAENEALRKGRVITQTVDYCADDLAKALKTIDEQKAEIERLTEENAILKGNPPLVVGRSSGKTIRAKLLAFDQMKEQNTELQKRVDELKKLNAKYLDGIESVQAGRCRLRCELTQQTVKDTAKEILQKIMNIIKKSNGFLAEEVVRIMAKQNGVEVE